MGGNRYQHIPKHIPKRKPDEDAEIFYKGKGREHIGSNIIERKKYNNTTKSIIESLSTISPSTDNIENLNLDILKPAYIKEYSQELLNLLLHHTSFYDDMFKNLPELTLLKEYLYKENHKEEVQDQEVSIIRFQQLYNKFKVKVEENPKDKLKLTHILKKTYHVENYIDNLLFAEYINTILGIGDSQTLIINNTLYTLYVSSLHKDIYHGADIFLEDESGKTIGIDITLYKKGISGKSLLQSKKFDDNIIINYTQYRKDFESFIQEYKNYILNQGAFPQGYSKYTSEQVYKFEQRISNIINPQNNILSSPDQDIDSNA